MQAAIDRRDGCSDKFLGDAVLAFWNGLADEPDHALKALETAQDIIGAISSAEGSEQHRLAARAVVCSGRVYVGDLGAKQRSNFTIIGPAVNETFRLEKVPDDYGLPLLVAASTAEMIIASKAAAESAGVLESNVLVRIDDIELKGFAGARSIYALVPRDDPGVGQVRGRAQGAGPADALRGTCASQRCRQRNAATSRKSGVRSLPVAPLKPGHPAPPISIGPAASHSHQKGCVGQATLTRKATRLGCITILDD